MFQPTTTKEPKMETFTSTSVSEHNKDFSTKYKFPHPSSPLAPDHVISVSNSIKSGKTNGADIVRDTNIGETTVYEAIRALLYTGLYTVAPDKNDFNRTYILSPTNIGMDFEKAKTYTDKTVILREMVRKTKLYEVGSKYGEDMAYDRLYKNFTEINHSKYIAIMTSFIRTWIRFGAYGDTKPDCRISKGYRTIGKPYNRLENLVAENGVCPECFMAIPAIGQCGNC